jgi:hypothetical protein
MQRRMSFWRGVGVLAALVVLAGIVPASAQTQGTARRAGARAAKQACKAGDEKSRAECRQVKREVKHGGTDEGSNANAKPAPNPAKPAPNSAEWCAPKFFPSS